MNFNLDNKYNLFALLLITFFACIIGIGSWGLTETSESRYAQISKEMYETKDYLHPKLLEINHLHKPPLTYQITTLGYTLFGVNEFGARFFLQVALILQLIFVYLIGILLFKEKKIALVAAVIYFSLPFVLISIRNLTTDAYLNTFIIGSIYFWLKYKKQKTKHYLIYLFFLFLGLIMNTKGPVGLIFPILFIVSYSVINKIKIRINLHVIIGLILFIFLSVLWLLLLLTEDDWILNYFLDEQILKRVTSKSYNRYKPFWYFLVFLPLLILPWIKPTILGIVSGIKKKSKVDKSTKLLVINILAIVLVFSLFSTKLILYILPVSLYVALLCAKIICSYSNKELKTQRYIISALIFLVLIAIYILPLIDTKFSVNYYLLSLLALIFIVFITILQKSKIAALTKLMYVSYFFVINLFACNLLLFTANDIQINSIKTIMEYINTDEDLKTRNIVVYNYLLSSASFYSNNKIITINDGNDIANRDTRFEKNENWRNSLIDAKNEVGLLKLDSIFSKKIVLFTRKRHQLPKRLKHLQAKLPNKKDFDKWIIYY